MIVESHHVELGSDEGCFVLRGIGTSPDVDTSLVRIDDRGREGDVLVHTGGQWGPFSVTTVHLDAPSDVGDEWEDVVEHSVTILDDGLVVAELVNHDPSVPVVTSPGSFRVRVSARGRTAGRDFHRADDEDDEPALEHYLVEAWPAPVSVPVVVRMTSRFAAEEADPPRPPVIAGEAAALAAAARIGRDVDGDPGTRHRSGEVGRVVVEARLRGTRRRLFPLFAHIHSWSPGLPSWSFMSGPGDEYALGVPTEAYGGNGHPDQLTGRRLLRTTFVEVERPRRVVRTWNWHHRDDERAPVLADDTTVTTTLAEEPDAEGQPWTTVHVVHAGLPVEWLDDLEEWWRYQLAIADVRERGTR